MDYDRIQELAREHTALMYAKSDASHTKIHANGLCIDAWEIGVDFRLDVKPDNSATTLHFNYRTAEARDRALKQLQEPPIEVEATDA
jgi:hypothetical protein